MRQTRRSDFAGAWYPGSESECREAIEALSRACKACPGGSRVVGGIVPHAGWVFSGGIACNVIKCVAEKDRVDTCLIFGKHMHPGSRNSIMSHGKWATPLGDLEIDSELAGALVTEFPFREETASSYEQDNTIELQLPFIKYFFPQTRIVPIGLPPNTDSLETAVMAAQLAKRLGREAVILGSTDLTHYGYNFGFVPKGTGPEAVDWVKNSNDRRVVDLMLKMDGQEVIRESLENHNACCGGAAASAIEAAKELGARRAEELDYSTSYDISPGSSFVGYVGIVFYE